MQPLQDGDPRRIGRYEVLARIGEGGMGRVLLGQSDSGRRVALKVVHADLARTPGFRERFAREIAAARTVGGFWTAAVVDADAEAELPWLATEFIPGPSLEQFVRAFGPLPAPELKGLAVGLCEAVAAIHRAGLIHRDLKPTNVLLLPDGPRVIDFGISRAVGQATLATTQHIVGTPGFMAPEQVEHGQVSAASDVFGIGLVLVFAATGRPLYGGDLVHFAYQVVHGQPDLADVAPELRPVVARCLTKDPAERPTALELLDSLAAISTVAAPVDPAGWDSSAAAPGPESAPATEHIPARNLPAGAGKASREVMVRRRVRGAAATVLAGSVLTGGGIAWEEMHHHTGQTRQPSSSDPSSQSGRPDPTAERTDVDKAAAEKACKLLTFDQVKQLTGIVVHGTNSQSSAPGDGSCFWVTDDPVLGLYINLSVGSRLAVATQCIPNDGNFAYVAVKGATLPEDCTKAGGASIFISDGHDSAFITVYRDRTGQDGPAGLAVAEAVRAKI